MQTLAAGVELALRQEAAVVVPRVTHGLDQTRFVQPVLRERVCVRSSAVEAQVSTVIEIASCRSGMGRSRRRLVVCSGAQMAEEGVLIVKELEVLLTVAVVAEALEAQRREVEVVVQMESRRVGVVEGQAVRRLELVELELVTLMVVEGPCQTASEMREVELAASCQSVEGVLALRLCSRLESRQA